MKIPSLFFLFCFLVLINLSMAQILEQNFDGLDNIEEFKADDPNDPGVGQVERINLNKDGDDEIFSLGSDGEQQKYLKIEKKGNQMRHFDRLKGINDEGFLKISFSFLVDQSSGNPNEESQRFAAFIVGRNLNESSFYPERAERWGQVGIHIRRNGSYFLANEIDGNVIKSISADFTGEEVITIVMNNSGGNMNYTGPGGGEKEIGHQMVDIWVGEVREVENSGAYLGSNANLSSVKFLLWNNSQTATARLDDLVITNDQGFDPLPVVLTSFTATKSGDDVVLDWETASEMNSSHFEVERSLDGEQFEKVGKVSAAGNSHSAKSYSFPDKQAGLRFAGTLYYRLHQVDTDGASEHSPVSRIELPAPESAFRRVYPNPFKGDLNVGLITDKSMEVSFRLLNLQGATLIKDFKITEAAGQEQVFRFTGTESLQAGMYILEIASAGEKKRYRVVKL